MSQAPSLAPDPDAEREVDLRTLWARVVDRWWTEEPVSRRYFDVVLETGEHAVVFHDEGRRGWFTQRGI